MPAEGSTSPHLVAKALGIDLRAAGRRLWELHAQDRGWEELDKQEQDQMISEAEEVIMHALGIRE